MTIRYIIKTKYWRRQVSNIHDESHNETPTKANLVETKKEFHHGSPIEARKAVFEHYRSVLEVLYSGLGISQTTDKQARIDLQYYLDSGNGIEYFSKYPDNKYKVNSMDMYNGIEIYMIVNSLKTAIHGIRYLDYADNLDVELFEDLEGLVLEHKHYTRNNYPVKGFETSIDFTAIGGNKETFIETPVNWYELVNDYAGLKLIS
jgi:hypothetical protein